MALAFFRREWQRAGIAWFEAAGDIAKECTSTLTLFNIAANLGRRMMRASHVAQEFGFILERQRRCLAYIEQGHAFIGDGPAPRLRYYGLNDARE